MTLQTDMDADRSAVFLDTSEFATTITYTTRSGSSTITIPAVRIEQIFAITDNKNNALFHISAADVAAPLRGDRIVDGDTFQVADVQSVDGMFELRCLRMQDTQ